MKPGNDNRQARDGLDERLLDRLVDGELADDERRDVLWQLAKEPDGWRRCALAFLEAQTWRQALATAAGTDELPGPCVMLAGETPVLRAVPPVSRAASQLGPPETQGRKRIFWRPVARLTGLAAGLAVAFAFGWAYHGGLKQIAPSADVNPQAGSVADRSNQPPQPPSEAVVKVATEHSRPTKPVEAAATIAPIVKNLQQRGYSVETEQRLVSMESKDGRKVKLPVQEVRIRYVGDHIY